LGTLSELNKDKRDVAIALSVLDNTIIRTNPFGANISGENSYKRAERICAAVHLITNHVPETEPLRTRTRTSGLELLECLLELRSGFRAPGSEKGQTTIALIRKLMSEVRLLAVAGYISVQNASAVAEALDELGSLIIVSQRSVLAEQISIAREDLIPRTPVRNDRPRVERGPRNVERSGQEAELHENEQGMAVGERRDRIVEILRAGGVLGIKDIAANLPQYSEKMVQRELVELVRSGRVVKTGEKRWSRYRVVS